MGWRIARNLLRNLLALAWIAPEGAAAAATAIIQIARNLLRNLLALAWIAPEGAAAAATAKSRALRNLLALACTTRTSVQTRPF
jgi:hypothetical protein